MITSPSFALAGKLKYVLALSACLTAGGVHADNSAADYPNKPITYVIGFSGVSDAFSRAIGGHLQKRLGQPIIVDSKLGAQGDIAATAVARAKPDGYTVGMVISNLVTNPLMGRSKLDPVKDFAQISMLGKVPVAMVISTQANPSRSLKEFIDLAISNPASASFASAGTGGMTHLTGALLNKEANINMVNIPYKGGGQAINDLLGGQVPAQFFTTTLGSRYIGDERVKFLALASDERIPEMPDLPTFKELGYPAVNVNEWYALVAPAGTPPAIIDKLNKEIVEILKEPDVARIMPTMITKGTTPNEVRDFMQAEAKRWAPFIKELGGT